MNFEINIPEKKAALQPNPRLKLPPAGSSANVSIRDWLAAVQNGQVVGYPNNRGGGKVAVPTVKSCRDHLDLHSLGCFTVAGSTLADGHSRTLGMHLRWCQDMMKPEELAGTVTVKVVPSDRLIGVYGKLNSGKGHTAGDKLSNVDLALGRMIHQEVLSRLVRPEVGASLTRSQISNLSYICYAIGHLDESEWDFAEVFAQRKYVQVMMNLEPGELPFHLDAGDARAIAGGVDFFGEFCDCLGKHSVSLASLKGSGPFFGMVVADRLSPSPQLPGPKTLAGRAARKAVRLSELVPVMTHGSTDSIRRTTCKIEALLSRA